MASSIYQLNKLQFCYADKLVLSLDKLQIQQGKTTALVGANGSGKSTLLNLLAFLTTQSQGELLFNGQVVKSSALTGYRRQVGFLAQKPFMLRGTVYDNMQLALNIQGKKQAAKIIPQVLEQLGIAHCAHQQAKQLSGGELQKAALARILALEPKVLLLDEPFSYLDEKSAQALTLFLQNYTQQTGKTLIFSTHDRLQGVAIADEVLALAAGKQVLTPLINLFHGELIGRVFHSGSMQIILDEVTTVGRHVSIDPQDVFLSVEVLESSMLNHFQGRVVVIADESGKVRVNVDTGVIFQVLMRYQDFMALNIKLGDCLWVNFKSHSVVVF